MKPAIAVAGIHAIWTVINNDIIANIVTVFVQNVNSVVLSFLRATAVPAGTAESTY